MGTRIEETNTSGEKLTISKAEQHSFFSFSPLFICELGLSEARRFASLLQFLTKDISPIVQERVKHIK